MISLERIEALLAEGKEMQENMKECIKQLNGTLDYKPAVMAYKDRVLINEIIEVYRDLLKLNKHPDIKIILDRVEE